MLYTEGAVPFHRKGGNMRIDRGKRKPQYENEIELFENSPKNKFRSVDLFAGIGGIRAGFEQAFGNDMETVFVSEWDPHAQKTYRANFHDAFEPSGDITATDEKSIPPFDICLAGFPCQAFSLAGRKLGFGDDYKGLSRGTLFFDVVRICAYRKPAVIFCENVKGLRIHDKGRTFKVIARSLAELGYTVFHKVLNSKDFGVPQNRERIYIVAFRSDLRVDRFEFPTASGKAQTIRDILESEPVSAKYYLSEGYLDTLRKHRARHEEKGNGFGYAIRGLDGTAAAIVCGGMGRERNLIVDHRICDYTPVTPIKGAINREDVRKMTPREWARLQGFPDSFRLPLSDVHLYKQLGNSVTVPVIRAIAERIREALR
jgi:DNA (cytosine-5)-methyltransferase 1